MIGVFEAVERVRDAYRRIVEVDRPEVWISLREFSEVLAEAAEIDARVRTGEQLPLAGVTVAVKDNIDVAGMPTTAGCPGYGYLAERDACAVARLRAAGAIVIGKTALDQFATGLVGTRSPHGAVRDWRRPSYVSGGSSSGSAIAVASGAVDIGLTTDTAGSGRVPAAFQGLYGIKPTIGLVPVSGTVAACRSFDCVGVMARELDLARVAAGVMAGRDVEDRLGRAWPADAPLAVAPLVARAAATSATCRPRIAVFSEDSPALADLPPSTQAAFRAAVARLGEIGAELVEVDCTPFLAAGQLLYGGAFVAERFAAVGEFVDANISACDPTVAAIVLAARNVSAAQYVADRDRLDGLKLEAAAALAGCVALLTPTVPFQPTIAEVSAEPIEVNKALGRFTTFTNLLDLCAVALPFGEADGAQFGVTLHAPAFHDLVIADLAAEFAGEAADEGAATGRSFPASEVGLVPSDAGEIPLLVVGAHLRGEPLNHQLTTRGARFLGAARTAPTYRLFALATDPPKPGLVREMSAPDPSEADQGAAIAGELWALAPVALASFLAELPAPMALTQVQLDDGRDVVGFSCEATALRGAVEITEFGGWRAFIGHESAAPAASCTLTQ